MSVSPPELSRRQMIKATAAGAVGIAARVTTSAAPQATSAPSQNGPLRDLVLSNGSLRFRCPAKDFPGSVYSCGGYPKDDLRAFRFRARLTG